tara:strand:- start:7 stop:1200 length:1194 start_codon:yes stop_codon:yes gene_type:complete
MTTYYYNEDATTTVNGLSEAGGYDGSTTATLPDSSSAASRLSSVVGALQSGDILYVKKASGDITWHASITTSTHNTDGPTRATDVGPVDIIGYGTSVDDGIRPNVNMQSFTWRFNRAAGMIKSLNFKGSYANAGVLRISDGALLTECRVESSAGIAVDVFDEGKVDRCEIINTESVANPAGTNTEYTVRMYPTDTVHITNSYIESRNGSGGIYVTRRSGGVEIKGCIINVNLDVDGAGNLNGHGIEYESLAYNRGTNCNNIIHNANTGILMNRSGSDDRGPQALFDNIISSCNKAIDGDSFYNQPANTSESRISNPMRSYNNFFYANTSNSFVNNETNPTFLTSDPFVNVATKDFTIKQPTDLGYAKEFQQAGASGDTITKNSLIGIRAPGEIARSF